MIAVVLGIVANAIAIIKAVAGLPGVVKRWFADRSARKRVPETVTPQRSRARVYVGRPRSRIGDDAWAGTYATPGSYAERVRANARARGLTPSDYINGKR